jgi:hypothetical protein
LVSLWKGLNFISRNDYTGIFNETDFFEIVFSSGDAKARECISELDSFLESEGLPGLPGLPSDVAQEILSEYEKAVASIENVRKPETRKPQPSSTLFKSMDIFEHWVATQSVEMLVEFYRSQDAGRKPCLDIAKQILDQLNIKDLAVVHLSLAAEIVYMAQSCFV